MIHGDDIYVLTNLSGTQAPIAAAKTGDLDISQDFIKACAPGGEGRTFRKIPTTYDWSVSCDCLMADLTKAKEIIDAARNGTELTLQFICIGWKVRGSVYVKSARITASKGSLAKLSVSFESSGPLTDANDWDFINGTLYTYSNFAEGTLNIGGYLNDGTMQHDAPAQEQE